MEGVQYSNLSKISQNKSVVWCGCIIPSEDTLKVQNYLIQSGLIDSTTRITSIAPVLGNVKGEEGRTDTLIRFSKDVKDKTVCELIPDLMMVADFIVGASKDYTSKP